MKPQCNSAADCLRELARVMDQFVISDPIKAVRSRYVKTNDLHWNLHTIPPFMAPETWSFAIAEVEGKPVFIGDELYDWKGDVHKVPYLNDGTEMDLRKGCEWTWNPPRPKTVTVDLPYDFVFIHSELNLDTTLVTACKKALEELK